MKKTITLLFILSFVVSAQAQVLQWGVRMGAGNYCGATGTAIDAAGNVYTTGYFTGTVDFNPGAGVSNLVTVGGYDAYIQKLDANGNFVWAAKMGQSQDDRGERVSIDGNGDVIVAGTSNGLFNLGLGRQDIGVWKFSAAGSLLWSKKIGFNYFDYATAVTTDAANNIYITGTFENSVDFNPGGTPQVLTATGNLKDMYVLKLLANGNFRWVKQIVSATGNPERAQQIMYNSSNNRIYFGGIYYGKTDFNPAAGIADTFYLDSQNPSVKDVFVSQMDTAGNFVSAIKIGNQTEILFGDLAINPAGNRICVTGGFRATVDFNPGVGTFTMDAGLNVGTAVYCCMLNSDLTFQSAFQLPSQTPFTNSVGLSAKFDAGNNLYLGGRVEGTVDLAPDAPVVNYTSAGGQDMFLIKLDPTSNFIFGNGAGNADNQVVTELDVNSFGEIYIVGSFSGTLNFSMTGSAYPLVAAGLGDAYIVKYAPSYPLPLTYTYINATLKTDNEVLISWATASERNTSHFDIEKSTDGLNWLLIGSVQAIGQNTVQNEYDFTDARFAGGTAYYRIKQSDMDGRFTYSETRNVSSRVNSDIQLYPNPCNMILNVSLPQNHIPSTIEIITLDGRRVIEQQTSETYLKINVNALTKGTYMLRVYNAEKQFTTKFVKQ